MRELYPEIEPRESFFVDVGNGHVIYAEESGNPAGKPVVVLHGGPGAGSSPKQRRFFDPDAYRVVLLDQRGSGHSTPHAPSSTTPPGTSYATSSGSAPASGSTSGWS